MNLAGSYYEGFGLLIPSAVGFLLRDDIEVKVYLVGGLLGPPLLCDLIVSVRSSVV